MKSNREIIKLLQVMIISSIKFTTFSYTFHIFFTHLSRFFPFGNKNCVLKNQNPIKKKKIANLGIYLLLSQVLSMDSAIDKMTKQYSYNPFLYLKSLYIQSENVIWSFHWLNGILRWFVFIANNIINYHYLNEEWRTVWSFIFTKSETHTDIIVSEKCSK